MPYEWPLASGVEERFARRVCRHRDGCWIWTAFRNPAGYGMIRNGAGMALAHRLSWTISNKRPIPTGKHVLHHCDVPACVNPDHLYVGTNADNVRDKVSRGRSSRPAPWRQNEKHPFAKLTNAQVLEIRRRYEGVRGQGRAFAAEYGVSKVTIHNIVHRKSWANL